MEELISVIVPVYKVEAYLGRCVRSILAQTYKNLEIILVDDGSPDNCGAMCDEFAALHSRIHVLHKKNGGLSDARNSGVEKSNGKYIAFVDSDDYIAPNYIQYLYDLAIQNQADISCCGWIKTEGDTAEYSPDTAVPSVQVLTGIEACHGLFDSMYMRLVTAWGKLYRADLVKDYPFPKGRIHEDEATTCKYYYKSEKVAVGNQRLYAYYQNPKGIVRSQGNKLNEDKIWALEHKARFFEQHDQRGLAQAAWDDYAHFCIADSMEYSGRCDVYLKDLDKRADLSAFVRMELGLYSRSAAIFRAYWRIRKVLGAVKRFVRK